MCLRQQSCLPVEPFLPSTGPQYPLPPSTSHLPLVAPTSGVLDAPARPASATDLPDFEVDELRTIIANEKRIASSTNTLPKSATVGLRVAAVMVPHGPLGFASVSCIFPGELYLGNQWCAQKAWTMRERKIRGILNCAVEVTPPKSAHLAALGVTHYHKFEMIDSPDVPSSNITDFLHQGADLLHDWIVDQRLAVYAHCQMGKSRSTTIVLAFLIKHKKYTLLDALELVKKRRPMAHPNIGFLRQLIAFEQKVTGQSSVPLAALALHREPPTTTSTKKRTAPVTTPDQAKMTGFLKTRRTQEPDQTRQSVAAAAAPDAAAP
jgi:hypothetical protein